MDKLQKRKDTWTDLKTAVNTLKDKEQKLDNYNIPGVTKVVITPIIQKAIGCEVGKDVTLNEPCVYVKKEKLEGNIYLDNEKSVFLSVKKEIIEYPENDLLLVLDTKDTKSTEDFFVCVTMKAKESILNVIEKEKDQLYLRMKKYIERTPKKWKSLGSELEIDETLLSNFRPTIEVEINSKWPIRDTKSKFSMRFVEDAKDGYVELLPIRTPPANVYRKKIDAATQVAAQITSNEIQTNPSYPKNKWTQYCFEYNLKEDSEREKRIANFTSEIMSEIKNNVGVNGCINFYTSDYKNLVKRSHSLVNIPRQDIICFQNVICCKNKSVASVSWHPLISGLIAGAYAKISCNEIYSTEPSVDTDFKNAYDQHLVLVWTYTNHLKPILYLQAYRDVKCISFCPFNPNILVGGCSNGQIVIWDITQEIQLCEKTEFLTEVQRKHRIIIYSHMNWLKNIQDIPVIEPVVISHIDFGHKSTVNDIMWLPSHYEIEQNGYIKPYDQLNLQVLTCGADSVIYLWDLKKQPEIDIPKTVKQFKRLKQKPATLIKYTSELEKLNQVFVPLFKFIIKDPILKINIPLSKIIINHQKINYIATNPDTLTSEAKRTYFNYEFDKESCLLLPKFTITSHTGQLLKHTWQSYYIDPDADDVETFGTIKYTSIHDGPIDTCIRNPFIPELFLTVGGKIFAIWNESSDETSPIIWRKSKYRYLNGIWSSYHPGIVIIFRSDSHFEIWDMLMRTKNPDYVIRFTGNVIVDAFCETDKNHVRKNTYCTVDKTGAIKIYKIPDIPFDHKDDLVQYSKDIFLKYTTIRNVEKKRMEEWKKKYCKPEKTAVKTAETLQSETRVDELSEIKSIIKKTKFETVDKENAKLWNEKQYDHMYKILLNKSKLNLEEIEERKPPLIKAIEEKINREEKEKLMLSSKDNIFYKAKRLLSEEIKINERRDITVDLPRKSVPHIQASYITKYKSLEQSTLEYIKNNTYQYSFNWNKMISEGKIRRKVFNTHLVKENLHRKRWALKKQALEAETLKLNESKIEKLKKNIQDVILIQKHTNIISSIEKPLI